MNKNEIFVQGVAAGVILSAFVGVVVSFIIRGWRALATKAKTRWGAGYRDTTKSSQVMR